MCPLGMGAATLRDSTLTVSIPTSTDFTLLDLLILWFRSRLLLLPNFFLLLVGLIRSYSSLLDTTDILCALFTNSPQDIG